MSSSETPPTLRELRSEVRAVWEDYRMLRLARQEAVWPGSPHGPGMLSRIRGEADREEDRLYRRLVAVWEVLFPEDRPGPGRFEPEPSLLIRLYSDLAIYLDARIDREEP